MQIQLDSQQMEYLRRQAEAMERIAGEIARMRSAAVETQALLAEAVAVLKAANRQEAG